MAEKPPILIILCKCPEKTKALWFSPSPKINIKEEPAQSVKGQHLVSRNSVIQPSAKKEFTDTISDKVAVLKSLALDMSEEIDTQNNKINEINDHTDHVKGLVNSARTRTAKFLK
jgi:hypothetical protein